MSGAVVVNLVENGVTEITIPGQSTTVTEIGDATTEVTPPEILTLLSTGVMGDLEQIATEVAGYAAAALQSELNAANSEILTASEDLFAGALVNIWESSGPKLRLTDASLGREAMGYVLLSALADENVRVYFDGNNTSATGLVPGVQFLSAAPGRSIETAPTLAGHIVQRVGFASRATNLNFQTTVPITLS